MPWQRRRKKLQAPSFSRAVGSDISKELGSYRLSNKSVNDLRATPKYLVARSRAVEASFDAPDRSPLSRPYVYSDRYKKYDVLEPTMLMSLSDRIGANYSSGAIALSFRDIERARREETAATLSDEDVPSKVARSETRHVFRAREAKSNNEREDRSRPKTSDVFHNGHMDSQRRLLDETVVIGRREKLLCPSPKRGKVSSAALAERWTFTSKDEEQGEEEKKTRERADHAPTTAPFDVVDLTKRASPSLVDASWRRIEDLVARRNDGLASVIAPSWQASIDRRARASSSSSSPLVSSLREEIAREYRTAMHRTGILYALRSPEYRHEVGIDYHAIVLARNWQRACANPHLTFAWSVLRQCSVVRRDALTTTRRRVRDAVDAVGTTALDLNMRWTDRDFEDTDSGFGSAAFVSIDAADLRRSLPMEVADFTTWVQNQILQHRKLLNRRWIGDQVLPILDDASKSVSSDADRRRIARSVSAILSKQLRESVNLTMRNMLEFFEWSEADDSHAAFRLHLVVREHPRKTRTPLEASSKTKPCGEHFAVSPNISRIVAMTEALVLEIAGADKHFPSAAKLLKRPMDDPKEQYLRIFRMLPTSSTALKARMRLREIVENNRRGPEQLRDSYAEFVELFDGSAQKRVDALFEQCDDWMENGVENSGQRDESGKLVEVDEIAHALSAMGAEIERLTKMAEKASSFTPDIVAFPLFTVDCEDFKRTIVARADSLRHQIVKRVVLENRKAMKAMCRTYETIATTLMTSPANTAELSKLQQYWISCEDLFPSLEKRSQREIFSRVAFCVDNGKAADDPDDGHLYTEDTNLFGKILEWPRQIADFHTRSKALQKTKRLELEEVLTERMSVFEDELKSMSLTLGSLRSESVFSAATVKKCMSKVRSIAAAHEQAVNEAELINTQEEDIGLDAVTDYKTRLNEVRRDYEPLCKLWEVAASFVDSSQTWFDSPLKELNAEKIENEADLMRRNVMKVRKKFVQLDMSEAVKVADQVEGQLKGFLQDMCPLMLLVCTPGLRQRHWDAIGKIAGETFDANHAYTLNEIRNVGLHNHTSAIEETCVGAVKEYSLEKLLDGMEEEWGDTSFELKAYRNTGTFILKSLDEIQQLLDDQIVKTQSMRGSRYIAAFLDRCTRWENILKDLQAIMDAWLKMQGIWLYLQPIFQSPDINKQMPVEGKLFATVDKTWRDSMAATNDNPRVLVVAQRKGLLDTLNEGNRLLERIQKGLVAYLETKRMFFSRFFFLSDDELLEILAETKDPLRVQPHLKKCFEGIHQLKFTDKLDIMGMQSREKEVVMFDYETVKTKVVNPNDAQGQVEKWLLDVESVMRKTVALNVDRSMLDFETKDRSTWMVEWPGQIVLCVSQRDWTKNVEEAMRSKGVEGLKEVLAVLNTYRRDIVMKVRGKLSKLQRKTLSALCVIDVHNIQVVEQLISLNISSPFDFDWISQLRYYWDADSDSYLTGKPNSVSCRMITSDLKYAFEYLGNSSRLVITPLTDRCYRTLMGALQLQLGGAPEGPAGTGKTETVKDLAKALAMLCVVFNCSDGLDYKAMGKFFKGLASSGAWACFDEFNRIELEVLSVIAQQILTIQQAKILQKEKFLFEGVTIRLRPTCNAFITMNPGYAGRAELPDNLKALFRTVAMMVPDYAMIAEIILNSFGYQDGPSLSVKIVTCYKLCSEQLSNQKHYDYGMRAVMAVLRAANSLKRSDTSDTPEDQLMLRAIMDVNYAKFLSQDLPLFRGIIGDLFPGVELPDIDRSKMNTAMRKSCRALGLQPVGPFMQKITQIYEMMTVRHGFMIVGKPFGAKTSAWKVLQQSLGLLKDWYPDDRRWSHAHVTVINPKSITMGQLYGMFDPVSHEWTDGCIPIYYRKFANSKVGAPEDRKWMMFDGPVDAVWIENMNTVLDDNKKLCLMSGEIIAMSDVMSMIFEPMDLEEASPATVSRCGMIYMEPRDIGWRPLLESWFERFLVDLSSEELQRRAAEDSRVKSGEIKVEDACRTFEGRAFVLNARSVLKIRTLAEWLVDPCLEFVTKRMPQQSPTEDHFLVQALLRTLESMAEAFLVGAHVIRTDQGDDSGNRRKKGRKRRAGDDDSDDVREQYTDATIEGHFLFSLVWAMGATTTAVGRERFDEFLRKLIESSSFISEDLPSVHRGLIVRGWVCPEMCKSGYKLATPLPVGASIFDYAYATSDRGNGSWKKWTDTLPKLNLAPDTPFGSITVPTSVTASLEYFVKLNVSHEYPTLVVGPTGTGKSVIVQSILNAQLPRTKYTSIKMGFSAKTSCTMAQNIVDGKVDKIRKGVFGPPVGKRCVLFVDDFNMPEREIYGAQPPLELMRQLIGSGGWYDLKDKTWRTIVSTTVVAAMGPPGGGRNPISPRVLRHFNLICLVETDDENLNRIFSTIVDRHFSLHNFDSSLKKVGSKIVAATIDIFNAARKTLLPIPAKSHYLFNLRDVARVVQGVLLLKPYDGLSEATLARLWMHESQRVFGDRLTNDEDSEWLASEISKVVRSQFKQDPRKLLAHLRNDDDGDGDASAATKEKKDVASTSSFRRLFFGDYLTAASSNPRYEEISDLAKLQETFRGFLDDYNQMSRKKMDLVMFMFAVEHVARIARVLKIDRGNMLLVGVGGSGRQSLTRLAAFCCDYNCFQIAISKQYSMTEWREDVKGVLREAGCGQRPQVFLFSDSQIKDEAFVEDINNILNQGEVPNIFTYDEKMEIMDRVRIVAKQKFGRKADKMNQNDLYEFFLSRLRDRLHVVLAFSPVGDAFRERLRKFPSLINCCAIDWFREWPSDALVAVAENFLKDVKVDSDDTRASIVKVCQHFHDSVFALSHRFYAERKRHNYVTPTSYLELIKSYKSLLKERQTIVTQRRDRYANGVEKIKFAELNVEDMKRKLIDMQPVLKESQVATAKLMEKIQAKLPGVEKVRASVKKEADAAQADADAVASVKAECEAELAEALPALKEALAALNTLSKDDINEVRGLKKPPAGIILVMKAVCTMLEVKPAKVKDPNDPMKKVLDYWGPSKKLMSDLKQFIDSLRNYDRDNIKPKVIAKIRKDFISDPEFTPANAYRASKACGGMCKWVLAMEKYDRVAKIVAPKKAALAESERKLAVVMAALDKKKAELGEIEDDLAKLQSEFDEATKKKERLEFEVDLCGKKLVRAKQLIEGLGGEKVRWQEQSNLRDQELRALTGDVLIASGTIAYLGAFISEFRNAAISDWLQVMSKMSIPCSSSPTLNSTLGDPVQIRDWQIQGLPTDMFSTDNGLIVSNARRWPLMIDPQGQANKWVRNMEASTGNLGVIRFSQKGFLRVIENSVNFGYPVLLENVGETLDPAIEPILLRQVFRQGGCMCMKIGDKTVEYSPKFRFYITTKLRNPHYLPEVAVKVTLLNFMITPSGLEDQLLSIAVKDERPELEKQKQELILEGAKNRRILAETESQILHILSSSEGNILENEAAIETINKSKATSDDIKKKQKVAEETEKTIDAVRQKYKPVAYRAQILFFCTADLASIEPVYQYSLMWFINLFRLGIRNAEKAETIERRIVNLNRYFTYSLYANVMRSLLEKDKLLFSFITCVRILQGESCVDPNEWYFLLTGGVAMDNHFMNPASDWLSDRCWGEICRLSDLPAFNGLREDLMQNVDEWRRFYDVIDAHEAKLPSKFGSTGLVDNEFALAKSADSGTPRADLYDKTKLNGLQFLCILRCLRPDKVVLGVQDFIVKVMGQKFVEPPPFDLEACYNDSLPQTPLIFILSPGSDPMAALLKFSKQRKVDISAISLGQGQGPRARQQVMSGKKKGTWVVLQNCHLAVSWMPELEVMCEAFPAEVESGDIHSNFRLWLTSYPSDAFPVSILQNGVKMTNEPPKGMRANLIGSYTTDPISDPEFFNSVENGVVFRKLLFSLCFFHALVQERRQFGPLGWNIPYEFNESDLRISVRQLAIFIDEYEQTPWKALRYTAGQCNYGGRVTDDKDRRTLTVILERLYHPRALEKGCQLSDSEHWRMPEDGSYESYLEQIRTMPIVANPDTFGMHQNASITKDQNETTSLFKTILLTQKSSGGSSTGKSKESVVCEVARALRAKIPGPFDMEEAQIKYPIRWDESMNTVLNQELVRFNRLTEVIRNSLEDVQRAIRGEVVMSEDLEKMFHSVFIGQVPDMWMAKSLSYPSLKPLGGYFSDLLKRLEFFDEWLKDAPPSVYWISGFFFTQAFLTGTLQNYARKYTAPIDRVEFDFQVMPKTEYKSKPRDGAYVHGLFIEGARWNADAFVLDESKPKVLFADAPVIWLKPKEGGDDEEDGASKTTSEEAMSYSYTCPVYKTSARRGQLSTTGHSTNFVMFIRLPSKQPEAHWIQRGVAMLTQLDD
eukprot:g489.t1